MFNNVYPLWNTQMDSSWALHRCADVCWRFAWPLQHWGNNSAQAGLSQRPAWLSTLLPIAVHTRFHIGLKTLRWVVEGCALWISWGECIDGKIWSPRGHVTRFMVTQINLDVLLFFFFILFILLLKWIVTNYYHPMCESAGEATLVDNSLNISTHLF